MEPRQSKRAVCVRCCIRVLRGDDTVQELRYRLLLLPPGNSLALRILQQLPQVVRASIEESTKQLEGHLPRNLYLYALPCADASIG